MRAIHRGFRSFRRNYARNLVVVLLLFICLTFSMSMLSVKLAADSQVETIKQTVGNYGEIKVSSEYQMKQFESERGKSQADRAAEARSMSDEQAFEDRVSSLVPETLTDQFSRDNYITTYDRVLSARIQVSDISNTNMQQLFQMRGPEGQQVNVQGMNTNTFEFEGNCNGASASDFTTGAKKLVQGGMFTYEDYLTANPVVVIEKNLAAENDLQVGDTVEAQISGESGTDSYVELKVVGIYETVQAEDGGESTGMQNFNPAGNAFYAPVSVVQKLNGTPGYLTLGSYYFASVDDTAALEQTFKTEDAKVDGAGKYQFATDLSDYEAIADPLLKARNTAVIGLAGALGACAVIILLAMVIIVSGRTRELGILKAIGSTDRQVIGQFAVEILCICLVAIILAMGATALIGQSLGNWLLPKQSAQTTAEQSSQGGPPGGPMAGPMRAMSGDRLYKEGSRFNFDAATQEKEASKLNVVYRGSLFLYGILILVGLSLVGMAIPVFWIIRLRPARVLSME